MRYLQLFWSILRMNLVNEFTYKTNLLLQVVQSLVELCSSLLGLGVIFEHTTALAGWQPAQLVILLGIYILMRGMINVIVQPGMQQLLNDIHKGTLDFVLLKPVETQFLVSIQRVSIWASVDIVQGIVVLISALFFMGGQIDGFTGLAFAVALCCCGIVVYSFWLVLASCAFWFVRVESILAIFQTLYQAGRWPLSIYPGWLRFILTVLVPVAFATTIPAQALTRQLAPANLLQLVGIALIAFVASRWLWLFGLRSYTGASA